MRRERRWPVGAEWYAEDAPREWLEEAIEAEVGSRDSMMDDPMQVGIHAIGMIDRTIYRGAYKEGTATLFRGFKLWSR